MKKHLLIEGATWRIDGAGALVCVVMALLTYLLGMQPLLERHQRLATQQAQVNQLRNKAAETASVLATIRKGQQVAADWLAAHPLTLMPAHQANQRLAAVTALANQSNTALDDVHPGTVVTGRRYDTFPIRISGSGTYDTIATMLHRFRNTFPDMRMATLDISGKPSDLREPARFRIEFVWYIAPAPRTASAQEPNR